MDKRYSQKKLTKQKRKSQTCRVFEIKIDRSHLSDAALGHLEGLFKEAKWFYNYCLSNDNINDANTTLRKVPVLVGDEYEDRGLSVLQAQMKQGIKTRLWGSIMSLHALKEKGFKVGKLKFKGRVNSIPLKQYNKTFFIKDGKVRIQGLKQWLRVRGLEQIPAEAEIACATLVRKGNDYFVHIATYTAKQERVVPEASISKRLKRLDRKVMRRGKKAKSNNKTKDQIKRQKEYERVTNRKKDIRHKLVSAITSNFRYVCFQDESIHAWAASGHGKKIQHSGIGGIISDLKHKSVTPLEVDKFFPSTKLCPQCGKKNKPSLSDRVYECECGFIMDRDLKSSRCIETEGMKQIPVDYRELTLGEISTSTFVGTLTKISGIHVSKLKSLSQEAAAVRSMVCREQASASDQTPCWLALR